MCRYGHREEGGWTLIELLLVVVIIGILAAVAIPSFIDTRERAWQAELSSTVRDVALRIESEATGSNGSYADVMKNTADVQTFANAFQANASNPVTAVFGDSSDTSFCFTATHASLSNGENIVYDSDGGGITFAEDGSAACS